MAIKHYIENSLQLLKKNTQTNTQTQSQLNEIKNGEDKKRNKRDRQKDQQHLNITRMVNITHYHTHMSKKFKRKKIRGKKTKCDSITNNI